MTHFIHLLATIIFSFSLCYAEDKEDASQITIESKYNSRIILSALTYKQLSDGTLDDALLDVSKNYQDRVGAGIEQLKKFRIVGDFKIKTIKFVVPADGLVYYELAINTKSDDKANGSPAVIRLVFTARGTMGTVKDIKKK